MFTKTKIIGLGILLSMLIGSLTISAESQGLQYSEQNKLVTISYEDLTFTVNAGGQVPKFQIKQEDGVEFLVMFKFLAEYFDENGDGAFQYNETHINQVNEPGPPGGQIANILALPSIQWSFSGFVPEYEEGTENIIAIHFNFVSEKILVPSFDGFSMEIKVHFYLDNRTVDGFEILGGKEIKFDIVMNNWPWQRNDTNLALRFDITPLKEQYRVSDEEGNTVDTTNNSTGYEHKVENQNKVKNAFELGNETVKGFFAYANKANYSYQNEYHVGTVNCSYASNGDNTIQTYFSFEHFEEEVIYDPSLGVTTNTVEGENTNSVGSIELLTISAISFSLIATLIVVMKRRK